MAFAALPPGQPGAWTIYDEQGQPAVAFDVFLGCGAKAASKIAQNPVEQGSFATYNKIASPTALSVTLARTGRATQLGAMLDQLDALVEGTDLISVITPGRTYVDYSLESYDYSRTTDTGADRLLVSLTLQEVRQVEPRYSNEQVPPITRQQARRPEDADTVDAGKQQGQDVPPSVLTKIGRRVAGVTETAP